jgi:pimeloyl-ACP methyl ester carboxylesterase
MTAAAPVAWTSDGIRLVGDRWDPTGSRRGTVVLLHGGGQTRHSWHHAGDVLSDDGWNCVAYDARGHGESEWSSDYTLDAMSRDLETVVAGLEDVPVLVGASMGGNTALALVGRKPDACRALVLVDIVPRPADSGVDRILGFMEARPAGFASLGEVGAAVADYKRTPLRNDSQQGLRKNVRLREDGRWHWHWDPEFLRHVRSQPRQLISELLERAAAAVTVPTLVLRGGHSDVVGEREIEAFSSKLPGASIVEVPDVGHTVGGDENSAFVQALMDFLDVTFSDGDAGIATEG